MTFEGPLGPKASFDSMILHYSFLMLNYSYVCLHERCDVELCGVFRTSIVKMSLVCKVETGKNVHNHTQPSLNSHISFTSDAVAKA